MTECNERNTYCLVILPMVFLFFFLPLFSLSAGGEREAPAPLKGDEKEENKSGEGEWQEELYRLVKRSIESRGVESPKVLEAMRSVPRHEFVPPEHRNKAYTDQPLPIGHGQTISQPYIVAYMTELLQLQRDEKVLEIGTGSGYQAAVLSEITEDVYTIEIIQALAESVKERFSRLGYDEVKVLNADGYYGWEEHAPFDAVIVTAAAGHIPPPLIEQLVTGGRMVIPVGGVYQTQHITLVRKGEDGTITTEQLLPVRFVPFTGKAQE